MLRRGAIESGNRRRSKRIAISGFSSQTLDYKSRLESTQGIISANELAVVDFLVAQLIAQGLWNKIAFLWTPFGDFPNGVLTPIKHPRGSSLVNNGFTSNAYQIKTGMKGDLSGWLNTQTTEADYPDNTNTHIALFLTQLGTKSTGQRDIGVKDDDRFQFIVAYTYSTVAAAYYRTYTGNTGLESVPIPFQKGFYLAQRSGVTAKIKLDGIDVATASVGATTQPPDNTKPIAIFQAAFDNKSDRGYSLVSIGQAFTDAEAQAYNTIVAEYQTRRESLTNATIAYPGASLDLLADRGIDNPSAISTWTSANGIIARQIDSSKRPTLVSVGHRKAVKFDRATLQHLIVDPVQAAWQAIYIVFRLSDPTFTDFDGIFVYRNGWYEADPSVVSDESYAITGIATVAAVTDSLTYGGELASRVWLNGTELSDLYEGFHNPEVGATLSSGWNLLVIYKNTPVNKKVAFIGLDPAPVPDLGASIEIGAISCYETYSDEQRVAMQDWVRSYYQIQFLLPDTLDFQSRILANGGTISDLDLLAIDSFVKAIYSSGLRSKFRAFYPYAGNDWIAAREALWAPQGSPSQLQLIGNNFVASDYSRTGGFKGDETKGFNSGIQGSGDATWSYSVYLEEGGNASAQIGQGSIFGDYLAQNYYGTTYFSDTGLLDASTQGWYTAQSSNVMRNGVILHTTTGIVSTTNNIHIHGRNAGGTFYQGTNRAIGCVAIGTTKTQPEEQTIYNAVQALMTAFGRAV